MNARDLAAWYDTTCRASTSLGGVLRDRSNLRYARFAEDLRSAAAADEWRGNWAMALLYRRAGVALAWALAGRVAAPSVVTGFALLVALTLPLLALALPLAAAPWAVCAAAVLFQILDCTDGTLARVTNAASKRGGDLDFLVDMAQWAMLYLAIGILADRVAETGAFWTAIGAGAAWARLMARVVRDRLKEPEAPASAAPPSFAVRISRVLGGISGLLPFLALAGAYLPWAVSFLLIYALLDIAEGLAPLFRR